MTINVHDIMNMNRKRPLGWVWNHPAVRPRLVALSVSGLLSIALLPLSGCGGGKIGKKQENFFTSGSREADQRASQNMAKAEQLAGTGEGAGEKGAKKAKPAEGGSGDPKAAQAETKLALFERLGGEKGLTAIIDDFVPRALEDPRVNWQRRDVKRSGLFRRSPTGDWNPTPDNVARLKKHLLQFLSLTTGGPAQYNGKEIKSGHDGMNITNPEFDATIGDLKATLDKLQIPNREQKELLAIVESTRPQIVTVR